MEWLVNSAAALCGLLSLMAALWGGYYLVVGLMSWRRPMDYGWAPGPHPLCGTHRRAQ